MKKILAPCAVSFVALFFSIAGLLISSEGLLFAVHVPSRTDVNPEGTFFIWPFLTNMLLVFFVVATILWLIRHKLWMSTVGKKTIMVATLLFCLVPALDIFFLDNFWSTRAIFAFSDPELKGLANSTAEELMARTKNGDEGAISTVCSRYSPEKDNIEFMVEKYGMSLFAEIPTKTFEKQVDMKSCFYMKGMQADREAAEMQLTLHDSFKDHMMKRVLIEDAIKWYEKAAEMGHDAARVRLAEMKKML